jgi:hypothetical protein
MVLFAIALVIKNPYLMGMGSYLSTTSAVLLSFESSAEQIEAYFQDQ